jgi:hypothetical protein
MHAKINKRLFHLLQAIDSSRAPFAPVVMLGTNGTITTIDNTTETNITAGREGE